MAEYIERKKLEEAFDNADPDVCESDMDGYSDWGFGRENVRDVIRGVPAADVVPVVHGRWRYCGFLQECQTCGEIYSMHGGNAGKSWNYCPNCGAKMDLEDGGGEDAAD